MDTHRPRVKDTEAEAFRSRKRRLQMHERSSGGRSRLSPAGPEVFGGAHADGSRSQGRGFSPSLTVFPALAPAVHRKRPPTHAAFLTHTDTHSLLHPTPMPAPNLSFRKSQRHRRGHDSPEVLVYLSLEQLEFVCFSNKIGLFGKVIYVFLL